MGLNHRAIRMVLALVLLALIVGMFHYGRDYLQASRHNVALVQGDPDQIDWDADPGLLFIKAFELSRAGRLDEAIATYRLLEQQLPDEEIAEVLYNLGTTHFQLAQQLYDQPRTNVAPVIQQARISFMRALRADAELYEAKYNLEYLGFPRLESPADTEGATDDVTDPEVGGTHRWQLMQDYPEGMP